MVARQYSCRQTRLDMSLRGTSAQSDQQITQRPQPPHKSGRNACTLHLETPYPMCLS